MEVVLKCGKYISLERLKIGLKPFCTCGEGRKLRKESIRNQGDPI
jgi:hypothetical protein